MILVPYLSNIEPECQYGLQQLEAAGARVWRRGGSSAIDLARNVMASEAINCKYIFFIDADIGFDYKDALRLINDPEPVISGIYSKKGIPKIASVLAEKVTSNRTPLLYAAAGFLRIQTSVLTKMIKELELPLCNTKWGKGLWPFFQPTIVDNHYLSEDWAFSHRLRLIGITPIADLSIRLTHWGRFGYEVKNV